MATKTKPKSKGGRPTDYREEFAPQVRKLFLLKQDATDADIADFFGKAESTINLWKTKHPEFLEAIRAGKTQADVEVAQSLYDRATGAVWTEQQAFKVKCGKDQEKVVVVDVVRAAPPDTQAIGLWLQNRDSSRWRKNPEPGTADDYVAPVKVEIHVSDARKPESANP